MIAIDFEDETLLWSFADFLTFKLPGEVTRCGSRLLVALAGALEPGAERRVLERLLWAWQVEQGVEPPARVVFSAVRPAPAEPSTSPSADAGLILC